MTYSAPFEVEGVALFHSETGTEGGWYAFQANEWVHTKDEKPEWCPTGDCWAHDKHNHTGRHASYHGLILLKNGDHAVIRDPKTGLVVFDDVVKMTMNNDLYTKDSKSHVLGAWVNQEPVGVRRELWARWFMQGYPMVLQRGM